MERRPASLVGIWNRGSHLAVVGFANCFHLVCRPLAARSGNQQPGRADARHRQLKIVIGWRRLRKWVDRAGECTAGVLKYGRRSFAEETRPHVGSTLGRKWLAQDGSFTGSEFDLFQCVSAFVFANIEYALTRKRITTRILW